MSAIATVLAAMGHRVSGSDAAASRTLEHLADLGVEVHTGHDPAWVQGVEVVARSTAVADENPEVVAARRAGLPILRRADILAAICAERRTLAVSGTHGKTTTSAMLAVTLDRLGWHPSMIVGGEIVGLGGGARWDPDGSWFVVEADESDGTFVELGAEAVVVTSVEADHLEFYGSMEGLEAAFERFVREATGPAVLCADDPGARRLGPARSRSTPPTSGGPVLTYGTSADADFRIANVSLERFGASFSLRSPAGERVGVKLSVPGLHNVRNASGVIATAVALGAGMGEAAAAVGAFGGVGRRFENRGPEAGIDFVDGYDHLPTEVAAAIATARSGGWDRVVVTFQPHRYSRTAALWQDFADAFVGADVVVLTGIYPAGEAPRPGVSGRMVHDAVARAHPEAEIHYAEDLDAAAELLCSLLRPGDVCLSLGAGDVTTLSDRVKARLR
jgi:UDP-N-acetylmuramate--alanine ligase